MAKRPTEQFIEADLQQPPDTYEPRYMAQLVSTISRQFALLAGAFYVRMSGLWAAPKFPTDGTNLVPGEFFIDRGLLRQVGPAGDGTSAADFVLIYEPNYSAGTQYKPGTLVIDSNYVMLCTNLTTDAATPPGSADWVLISDNNP